MNQKKKKEKSEKENTTNVRTIYRIKNEQTNEMDTQKKKKF